MEEKIIKAIKSFPQKEGYYVLTYNELSKKVNSTPYKTRINVVKMAEKGILEIRVSYALFGTLTKKGIKILKQTDNRIQEELK